MNNEADFIKTLSTKTLIILTAVVAFPLGAAVGAGIHDWRSDTFHARARLEGVYRNYADDVLKNIKVLRYIREGNDEKLVRYLEISLGVSYGLMSGTGKDFPEVYETHSFVQRAIKEMENYRREYPKEDS